MFIDLQNKVFGFTAKRPPYNESFSIHVRGIYDCGIKIITNLLHRYLR